MKIKANILLITLFLLMMSSLSALLVTAYIRNLIKLSASFHDYYKSYYVASAGLELSLVKTNGKTRGYGFEDSVSSESQVISSNFAGLIEGGGYFNTVIKTKSYALGDSNTADDSLRSCENVNNWYAIAPGGCVPIILLHDNKDMTAQVSPDGGKIEFVGSSALRPLSDQQLPNLTLYGSTGATLLLTKLDNNLAFAKGWSKEFSFADLGPGVTNLLSRFTNEGDVTPPQRGDRLILMITNTSDDDEGRYCLESRSTDGITIPSQYVSIVAQGRYRNTLLDLRGVRKAGMPADFCYTVITG